MEWYRITLEDTIKKLGTDIAKGLTEIEGKARLKRYGANVLPRGKSEHWWNFLLRQFKSPLIYILVLAAVITGVLREFIDMWVIIAAITVNVSVGFWQEFKSNNVIRALEAIVKVNALVRRNGKIREMDAVDLVPGDIVLLKTGMQVPASCRLITADHFEVNEAIITGESAPINKRPGDLDKEVPLGDQYNVAHMGGTVSKGEATAIVVSTGAETEIGKIALLTQSTVDQKTPLQIRMGALGERIAILVAIAAVIIFLVGVFEKHSLVEMFKTSIAVAVAAIPEGLPAPRRMGGSSMPGTVLRPSLPNRRGTK